MNFYVHEWVYLSEHTPLNPEDWLIKVKLSTYARCCKFRVKDTQSCLENHLTSSSHSQSMTSLLQHNKAVTITDPTICKD